MLDIKHEVYHKHVVASSTRWQYLYYKHEVDFLKHVVYYGVTLVDTTPHMSLDNIMGTNMVTPNLIGVNLL